MTHFTAVTGGEKRYPVPTKGQLTPENKRWVVYGLYYGR